MMAIPLISISGGGSVIVVVELILPFLCVLSCQLRRNTTPRSGVPPKLARKNLLQQLSVALWTYNARMILRYWALQGLMMTIPLTFS